MRVLCGLARVYVPGPANNPNVAVPPGKEAHYTVYHEVILEAGVQHSISSNTEHWFQGRPEGAVTITFRNRAGETRNIFKDRRGCLIKLTDCKCPPEPKEPFRATRVYSVTVGSPDLRAG